ncbi:MAG: amino acid transporter [Acidobacteria bacterium]|nr:amino acid transporter [Acidobacteriota bacterium]
MKEKKGRFVRWLLNDPKENDLGVARPTTVHQYSWWKVMCLTGVDYFSTLGYQPGIAILAAGALSPFATLVIVLLTLAGALPLYRRVAEESPYGDGSISMFERLMSRWKGKMFVLVLLGFVATSFIITITLSSADATAHIIENPYVVSDLEFLDHRVIVTIVLILMLGAVFLRGFGEVIGVAVVIVAIFLLLNFITIGFGLYEIFWVYPDAIPNWQALLWTHSDVNGSIIMLVVVSLVVFPKLALGLSGFETGVVVMPLVKSDAIPADIKTTDMHVSARDMTEFPAEMKEYIDSRIVNTKKLLTSAAVIMSIFLMGSSIVTTMLIPEADLQSGGKAYGRAISFIAHEHLGHGFGTVYDISTIAILWFAGASAMAGLLNIVPRYLPRYGMAPSWASATRPLVLVFTSISILVTVIFDADVTSQGGAYATGVLVLMASTGLVATISAKRKREKIAWLYLVITLVFFYTTIVNVIAQPDGIQIAAVFILSIITASFISRVIRTTELRVNAIHLDETARKFVEDISEGEIRIITNRREVGNVSEYRFKEHEKRIDNHIPATDPVLFFEVELGDASEFSGSLKVRGVDIDGYRILRTESPAVPNAIAGLLLYLRDETGKIPHVYFGWSEGNPIMYLIRYLIFGEGDTAPVTREILRQAEPDPELRPNVHVGG